MVQNEMTDYEVGIIPSGDIIACDTETTGLNPYRGARIFLYSFSDMKGNVSVVPNTKENKPMLQEFFENKDISKIFHNANFDIKMIEFEKIKVKGKIHDTIIMARLYDENEKSYNLEKLCETYLGFKQKEKDALIKWSSENHIPLTKLNYLDVPDEIMYPYAAVDAWNCFRLFKLYRKNIISVKSINNFYRKEIKCMRYMIEVENRGVLIDKKYCRKRMKELKEERDLLQKKVNKMAGMVIPPDGGRPLGYALFRIGEKCIANTEKGDADLSKKVLEKYDVPFVKTFLKLKTKAKLYKDIKDQILANLDKKGAIHTNFNLSKARTGRFSSSQPNLQNISKKGRIRQAFICRNKFTLFYFDYKQVELRLFAHFAGDKDLIKGFQNTGFDPHQMTATRLNVSKDQGKTINFAMLYGAGKKRIGDQLNISQGEAGDLLTNYHEEYPTLKELKSQLEKELFEHECITDPFGKRYHLESDDNYKAVNTLIQGTACNILKEAMLKVRPLLKGRESGMIQNIHDELVFEIHEEEIGLVDYIKEKMEDFHQFKVPITVDIEYSTTNWGEKKKWDEQKENSMH